MTRIFTFLWALPLAAKVGIPLALAALVVYAAQRGRIRQLEGQLVRVSFLADSTAAAADSSRVIELTKRQRQVANWDIAFTIVQRRAIQREQERDSVDRALQLETQARATLQIKFNALVVSSQSHAPVRETPEGVRSATFPIDSTPFHGSVAVELPPAPARGSMQLRIGVDPASIDLRLSCGAAPAGSVVRSALATVTAPTWLQVAIGRVEQDQAICNAAAVDGVTGAERKWGVGCSVGPSAVLIASTVQASFIGATCGISFRILP